MRVLHINLLQPKKNAFLLPRLSVSFGDDSNDSICLHLDVRFNEKQIIRSSHFPGVGWSNEQISDQLIGKTLKNPLRRGETFAIRLTVLQAIFQVHINDELYCTYDTPPDNTAAIRSVQVRHDFERIACFAHRQLFPDVYPMVQELSATMEDNGTADGGGYVFAAEVPQAMRIGTAITMDGWCAGQSGGSFAVDMLGSGSALVLMRFHVRFADKLVARNAQRLDGRFHAADEERVGVFPFKRGRMFRLTVHVTRECFVFYVNDVYFVRFNHRHPASVGGELAVVKCWASDGMELAVQRCDFERNFVATTAKMLVEGE